MDTKTTYPTKFRFDSKNTKLFRIEGDKGAEFEVEITERFKQRKVYNNWNETTGFVLGKQKDYDSRIEGQNKASYINIMTWKGDFNIFYKVYIPEKQDHICFRKIFPFGKGFDGSNFSFEFTEDDRIELIGGKGIKKTLP